MRRRRGRPRKTGPRHRDGRLKRQAETPRTVAKRMPHRRGLGENAADQRAATVLGRLVLRGKLEAAHGLAGETYLALWRGYVVSIAGPGELTSGVAGGFSCDGCADPQERKYCRCWFRRKVYEEARKVLLEHGAAVLTAVQLTVIHELPPRDLAVLKLGLTSLAQHFGLTARAKSQYQNAVSDPASSPA